MEEQSPDDQFAELTYPRLRLNDHTLDGILSSFTPQPEATLRSPPTANVGALDALPPELLQQILSQLDLRTLADFRQVNRRAIELVESLPQYKAITTHAPNALRGILAIRTGRWITCEDLYNKLCTAGCEECGDFGGYLYLLTCRRVCFLCFSQDKRYLPLSRRRASEKFGLDNHTIDTLPRMKVIRGVYSPNEKKLRVASVLFDYQSALDAGISVHGSLAAMDAHVKGLENKKVKAYIVRMAAVQRPGTVLRRSRMPTSQDPYDGKSENPLRFVAIVHVPWLNAQMQEVEWGFHCIGCKKSSQPTLHWRRKFTVASFADHLNQFGDIKDGKHLSD